MKHMTLCLLILLAPTFKLAGTKGIQIPMTGEGSVDAIFLSPSKSGKYPAIVYMHGGVVRERGNPVYKSDGDLRFDINHKVKDMSSMGFVVLVPIRNKVTDCCNGDDVVREGIGIAKASASYPRSTPNFLKDKLCFRKFI